jgi:hypothetical protein
VGSIKNFDRDPIDHMRIFVCFWLSGKAEELSCYAGAAGRSPQPFRDTPQCSAQKIPVQKKQEK